MQPLFNIIVFEKLEGYLIILLCKLYVSISVDITTKDPPYNPPSLWARRSRVLQVKSLYQSAKPTD